MGIPVYKRIVLKISGESLAGDKENVINPEAITSVSKEIESAKYLGVELAVVVGGGNIVRGQLSKLGVVDRVSADHMGMLATIINALALQDNLEGLGLSSRVMSAVHIDTLTEPYVKREALRHLKDGKVVILAGGTGNPYFTTDTSAALRAIEIEADVLMKGTKVNGVYDDDPVKNPSAKMFDSLSYTDVLNRRLKVMDLTAISLCMENKLPIIVFNLKEPGNLKKILSGEKIGSKVRG
ncbi:MAG: UMP kinase [candidate division Zixibacteria bacterium]|nr:UMP kinase [candidate division Zixibacteria bacterium]